MAREALGVVVAKLGLAQQQLVERRPAKAALVALRCKAEVTATAREQSSRGITSGEKKNSKAKTQMK